MPQATTVSGPVAAFGRRFRFGLQEGALRAAEGFAWSGTAIFHIRLGFKGGGGGEGESRMLDLGGVRRARGFRGGIRAAKDLHLGRDGEFLLSGGRARIAGERVHAVRDLRLRSAESVVHTAGDVERCVVVEVDAGDRVRLEARSECWGHGGCVVGLGVGRLN